MFRVPPVIVVLPVYVFGPERVQVPVPALVSERTARLFEMAPEMLLPVLVPLSWSTLAATPLPILTAPSTDKSAEVGFRMTVPALPAARLSEERDMAAV